ncbi:unnamed protein product, partial [Tetraodon nigroviridis]
RSLKQGICSEASAIFQPYLGAPRANLLMIMSRASTYACE